MISIKYLYIGIDDTDSPDGMCTTYLASQIINKLEDNGIELLDYPRLIRLNPFARFKTRGNGGVSLMILNDDKKIIKNDYMYFFVSCLLVAGLILFPIHMRYLLLKDTLKILSRINVFFLLGMVLLLYQKVRERDFSLIDKVMVLLWGFSENTSLLQ